MCKTAMNINLNLNVESKRFSENYASLEFPLKSNEARMLHKRFGIGIPRTKILSPSWSELGTESTHCIHCKVVSMMIMITQIFMKVYKTFHAYSIRLPNHLEGFGHTSSSITQETAVNLEINIWVNDKSTGLGCQTTLAQPIIAFFAFLSKGG